jgi:nitronate monooxygenase
LKKELKYPVIIQGGMGIAVSDWRLAKAVSGNGALGVVSGTAISRIFTSRLMDGDISGNVRRALSHFPIQDAVKEILERYYIPGGKLLNAPYRAQPVYTIKPSPFLDKLTVLANFTEVWLAKEGHSGVVGINLLEKVQMSNAASIYGAMLAGVDYIIMGAGIPVQVPAIITKLCSHEAVSYRLDVQGAMPDDTYRINFDPESIFPGISSIADTLERPRFLPVVSSVVLAQALIKRSDGEINGFIIEGPTAGGHNAPPRGVLKLDSNSEPVYGIKDLVDLEKIKALGLPFWLAGGFGHPQKLKEAIALGAQGIQVGTAFSLCNESGMENELKQMVLSKVITGDIKVITSSTISPTGFPFKVLGVDGTASDEKVYRTRKRICDLGFLRNVVIDPAGMLNYRCSAEPVEDFVRKGGKEEDSIGRTCLCNNLAATAGFPQIRPGNFVEPQLVTSGDDIETITRLIKPGTINYSAVDVINYLLGKS